MVTREAAPAAKVTKATSSDTLVKQKSNCKTLWVRAMLTMLNGKSRRLNERV